jgi:hypothetical protein
MMFFLLTLAGAEEYISADRPSVAVGSSVVGTQKTQVETGLQIDLIDGTHTFSIPTVLRYGINENIEVRLSTPLSSLNFLSLQSISQSSRVEGKVNFYSSSNISMGTLLGVLISNETLNADASLLVDISSGPNAAWFNLKGNLTSLELGESYPSFALGVGSLLYHGHGVFVETAGDLQSGLSGTVETGYFWLSKNLQIDVYVQQFYTEPQILSIAVGGAWKR